MTSDQMRIAEAEVEGVEAVGVVQVLIVLRTAADELPVPSDGEIGDSRNTIFAVNVRLVRRCTDEALPLSRRNAGVVQTRIEGGEAAIEEQTPAENSLGGNLCAIVHLLAGDEEVVLRVGIGKGPLKAKERRGDVERSVCLEAQFPFLAAVGRKCLEGVNGIAGSIVTRLQTAA